MGQIPIDPSAEVPDHSPGESAREVIADIAYLKTKISNVCFFGKRGSDSWILIDAGIPGSERQIREAAEERFGKGVKPRAIILTHAHFDHIGSLEELLKFWEVPVYAHPLEHRYLDGSESYPPPDFGAGGGMMTWLSPLYPRSPLHLSRVWSLPEEGSVSEMPGWKWIHVPGHTEGQIALWREEDRFLLSADAVITTRQESAYSVMKQKPELHGPPRYFTPDWNASRESVRRLVELEPEFLLSGHGPPLRGERMRTALRDLAADFDNVARPAA